MSAIRRNRRRGRCLPALRHLPADITYVGGYGIKSMRSRPARGKQPPQALTCQESAFRALEADY